MRVNFLIIGTQKGGTSALDKFLRSHPSLEMGARKELHYFDRDRRFLGKPNYDLYHQAFDTSTGAELYGEATPSYLYWPGCAARIHSYNPQMRLIALLRDPVERAHSHWAMEYGRDTETLSFSRAIRAERFRKLYEFGKARRAHAYVGRGLYARQLRRYLAVFPSEQILVLRSEDLRLQHQATLDRITHFLGVDRLAGVPQETVFPHPRAKMHERDREYLRRAFHASNRDLENLLGWDVSAWT